MRLQSQQNHAPSRLHEEEHNGPEFGAHRTTQGVAHIHEGAVLVVEGCGRSRLPLLQHQVPMGEEFDNAAWITLPHARWTHHLPIRKTRAEGQPLDAQVACPATRSNVDQEVARQANRTDPPQDLHPQQERT